MAIAKNYRRFPEALLYQLELALGDVRDTFEWMRVNARAAYAVWARTLKAAKADKRGAVVVPEWVKVAARKAKALALAVKGACMQLVFKFDQDEAAKAVKKPAVEMPQRVKGFYNGWLTVTWSSLHSQAEYRMYCHRCMDKRWGQRDVPAFRNYNGDETDERED